MGKVIRGAVVGACAIVGGVVAHEAIAHEKKAYTKCAEHLNEVETDTELLPIDCLPYGFEVTDTVVDGELVNRMHHMPARDDFLSKHEAELSPTIKYIIYPLAGVVVPTLVYVATSDKKRRGGNL